MSVRRPPRAAVRAAVSRALVDLQPGDRIVVALSGGADSLALTAGAAAVAADVGLICEAVVVDHQMQADSAEVARRAAEQARLLGCSQAHQVPVDVQVGPGRGGVEAAARAARYAALDTVARGAAGGSPPAAVAVLLGHTRDDQAETVLLGLARGSGTRSLAGMAPVSGPYRRPLLDVPREVVRAAAHGRALEDPRLAPWSDPHNDDHAHARVRVRSVVLPELERSLGPGVTEALARTAGLARQDADALDGWADRVWREVPQVNSGPDGSPARLPVTPLVDRREPLPAAVLQRVVRRFLRAAGCPDGTLTAGHLRAVAGLVLTPGSRADVALPGGRRARREADAVLVRT